MVVFFFFLNSQGDCQEFQAVCVYGRPWGVLGEESDMTTCILRGPWEPGGSSFPSSEPVASNSGHCPGGSLSCARRGGNSAAKPVAALASRLGCHPPLPLPTLQVFPECLCGHTVLSSPRAMANLWQRKEGTKRQGCRTALVGAPITAHEVHRYQADVNCLLPALSAHFHSSPTTSSPRPQGSPQNNVHGLQCGS